MALNIRAIQLREAVRYEPTTTTKTKEAVDGTRLGALTNRAIPFHEKFFFRRVFFFAPPDALSVDAMMGGPAAPGTNADGADR